jgi:phosphomannomutase
VGEINVSTELIKTRAVFGGEGNGGVMLPEIHPCRDAVVGMEIILENMAETGRSVAELVKALPRYHIQKVKVDVSKADLRRGFERFKRRFRHGKIDLQDGVRVDFRKSWVQARRSNTEPVVRIIAEAPGRREAAELVRQARAAFR